MNVCHYCKRPIIGETGWGMSENMDGSNGKTFHIECAEMSDDDMVVMA